MTGLDFFRRFRRAPNRAEKLSNAETIAALDELILGIALLGETLTEAERNAATLRRAELGKGVRRG